MTYMLILVCFIWFDWCDSLEKGGSKIDHFTLGQRIKYVRSMKKVRQSELAKGICSVSYLSKVENDNIVPSEDVEHALLKRLGIFHEDKSLDQVLSNRLDRWFSTINNKEREAFTREYELIKQQLSVTTNELILIKFKVYSVRYFMELKEYNEVHSILEDLRQSKFIMDYPTLYYYEKYQGAFNYKFKKFQQSSGHYEAARKYCEFIDITPKEKASLHYSLGLVNGKLNKNQQSIEYTKKSLSIYQSLYEFENCVHAHILLGILYKRSSQHTEAIEEYLKAGELSRVGGFTTVLHTIEHNLGTLYSHLNKSKLAIQHFNSSLQNECTCEDRLNTHISLSKEYFKSGKKDEAKKTLAEMAKALPELDGISELTLKEYELLTKIYSEDIDSLDKRLIKELLPLFEEANQLRSIAEYLSFIADYLYENGKYKKSSRYYALSYKYLNKSIT
ncbi:helix-turn-helix transcriptional regulator [[Bacillus] enclensis]|uniref:helix-turn-helix transcriptional regulator n=1 Tax=[Bacillus] enclensis TaxID=1402860 RepID=UPI0011461B7D|nr:helix-turn-helix transcriptional regulator [[Bacillus] enclensis]